MPKHSLEQLPMDTVSSTSSEAESPLAEWEIAMIDVFVRAAGLIGLPRSIGEIYGLLYCSPEPLNFDQISERLSISRGSVSQGLKILRQIGAVKLHYQPGVRKDHYKPELSMERLVRGFLKDQVVPHLESSNRRLEEMSGLIDEETDPLRREHAGARLNTLRSWQKRTQKLLPMVLAVVSGAKTLDSTDESDSTGQVI